MSERIAFALAACTDASARRDAQAFQIAHMQLEGAMMRLATETWALRPQKAARAMYRLRGGAVKHGGASP